MAPYSLLHRLALLASLTLAAWMGSTTVSAQTLNPLDPLAPLAEDGPPSSMDPLAPASPAETPEPEPVLPSPWELVPPVRTFPRQGVFLVPPRAPGFYSLRDVVQHQWRQSPPKFPYPPFSLKAFSFFDADFRYLENPNNKQHDFLDPLKRIHLWDDVLISTGGEIRYRSADEKNARLQATANKLNGQPARLTTDDSYHLGRARLYGDLWYQDRFRLFGEFLSAVIDGHELPPLIIDESPADLLNLFVDAKLGEAVGKPVYLRVGRQELVYGSQRLISTLDWANTRRTFQGIKAFRAGDKVDVDFFLTQPVIPDPDGFDAVDNDQVFAGAWFTYRPRRGVFLDAYYLLLDNTSPNAPPAPPARPGTVLPPFNVHTLGLRYAGDYDGRFLWDLEGMVQLGERGRQKICAGAFSTSAGYCFSRCRLAPQFWVGYDYASGDQDPMTGNTYETFNQLFNFGHYYFGFLDLVARQNIRDLNCQVAIYPVPWIVCVAQFHSLHLASARDALFNAAGVPTRRDLSGRAGRHVGEEIDLLMNIHLSPHADVLIGYSHLIPGRFIKQTGSGAPPDLLYVQCQYRW